MSYVYLALWSASLILLPYAIYKKTRVAEALFLFLALSYNVLAILNSSLFYTSW